MDMPSLSAIKGLLFDKDGTLLRYDESWGPVNRQAAKLAADGAGDDLENRLLIACGMDPVTGLTKADSLFAAGRKARLWDQFVALYAGIATEAEDDFHSLFGKAFVAAYEEQMAHLQTSESSGPAGP